MGRSSDKRFVTLDRVISALVASKNEAADDVLLEAVKRGTPPEQLLSLEAVFKRRTTHGMVGVVTGFAAMPPELQERVIADVKHLHHAIREAGRSDRPSVRLSAIHLIATARQGKLAYVLTENLHHEDEAVATCAAEALTELARWVYQTTRRLQKGTGGEANLLLEQRPEIEQAVARAIDGHRGKHAAELVHAGLLLCDWPGCKTLSILNTNRHGGQHTVSRRLQQTPSVETVDAFLQGASHAGLRTNFGTVFGHIEEAPVLDGLLRRTHWLKDQSLATAMRSVTRGAWPTESELVRDVSRRDSLDAASIAEWVAAMGLAEDVQDERLARLRDHAGDSFDARLRVFRVAARRRGTGVALLQSYLDDSDERLVRMAIRELVRRKPADYENILLKRITSAPESARRLIGRAVGHAGFEQFINRYDRLDKATRKSAGRAMLKLLPDAPARLGRRITTGPVESRLHSLQIVQELKLAGQLAGPLVAACDDASPKVRSKAVMLIADVPGIAPDHLIDKLLSDPDPRVRANAIEVLENRHGDSFIPLLIQRARSGSNRERGNAIKVMHTLRIGAFGQSLQIALADIRPEHRISAMWALRQTGFWNLVGEVGRMAKSDPDLRVRRYALGVLKVASDLLKEQRRRAAG